MRSRMPALLPKGDEFPMNFESLDVCFQRIYCSSQQLCEVGLTSQRMYVRIASALRYHTRNASAQDGARQTFGEFSYHVDKRCMLVSLQPGADFSRVCAHPARRPPISATHPLLCLTLRKWLLRQYRLRGISPQRISIHCSNILCLTRRCMVGNVPLSARRGTGLCNMLDMDF
jgi:hypothetical protein